jgi:adenosylhomocysteine nucleosidase
MKKLLSSVIAVASFGLFLEVARADAIAYFYALDADLGALVKAGKIQGTPRMLNNQPVSVVRVGAHDVLAVKMGSGSVRTAATAAALLAKFPCDLALSTGPAGGVSDRLLVGQWIRVPEVVAYQEGTETQVGFVSGKNAVRKLEASIAILPEAWSGLTDARVASGEVFISSATFRKKLAAEAPAVDMNLAGLSIACEEAGVPLACWKVISDHADEHAGDDFAKFVKTYDGEGGRRIAELVEKLPRNPKSPGSYENLNRLLDGGTPEN